MNGANANPVWAWMRAYCSWIPQIYIMNNVRLISWSPVTGSDTAWNFEKILIDKKGIPYRRYSYLLQPLEMTEDIEFLLSQE